MELWLDTLNVDIIRYAQRLGILSGVTTNPSILAQTPKPLDAIKQILDVQPGPVTIQVLAQDVEGMVKEARRYNALSPQIIVKVPAIPAGFEAIALLSREGVITMATVILEVRQALFAAMAGAYYLAPYYSQIEKESSPAIVKIERMLRTLQVQGLPSKIIVASLKSVEDATLCAEIGVSALTLKDDVFFKMIETTSAVQSRLEAFEKDWNKLHHKADWLS